MGDRGAILVIALIVITVVALVTGFVLTRGDGSLRATIALRNVAGATYAADAAAQIAINDLRTGEEAAEPDVLGASWAYNNTQPGAGCFGGDDVAPVNDLRLDGFYPAAKSSGDSATSAIVECTPEDGTGASGTPVPITNANRPGNAILTLGTSAAEDGIEARPLGDSNLRVRGGIWSNSNIEVLNNKIVTTTSIRARTGCQPSAASLEAPVVNCAAGAAPPDPEIAEPAKYRHDAVAGAPALQTVPANCDSDVTAFEPGLYDDANALENLTKKNACKNKTFWFKPGTYYFDFHNSSTDPLFANGMLTAGDNDNQWDLSVGNLVAGEPADGVNLSSLADDEIPGACNNPLEPSDPAHPELQNGVQFIFGGDSRMFVTGEANVEICGEYHLDRTPIALYGLKSGSASATTLAGADRLKIANVTTVTPSGTFSGADATTLQLGGSVSTWSSSASGNQSASIEMTGFEPATAIPKGSILTAAALRVGHREAASNSPSSTVVLTPAGEPTLPPITLSVRTGMTEDAVSLSSNAVLWTALRKAVHDKGWSGAMGVRYTAGLKGAGSAALDGLELELTYVTPQLRAQTAASVPGNCLTLIGAASACTLVKTAQGSSFSGELYIQGTTYAPLARIELNLGNQQSSVFRFGVIVRSLHYESTGNPDFRDPVIELPDNSPAWGFNSTLVQLKVYLCPAKPVSACAKSPDTLALKARVQLWDDSGTPDPPNRNVTVLSWSHQR